MVLPTIDRFAERWPQVALHVREGISSSLQEWLLDGRIDIAVLHTPPPLEALQITQALREQTVLVAPAADKTKAAHFPGKTVRLRDIIEVPLIMPGLAPTAIGDCSTRPRSSTMRGMGTVSSAMD